MLGLPALRVGPGAMDRILKAFISYRRHDSFIQADNAAALDFAFIDKLAEALKKAGFQYVFVDRGAIKGGYNYDSTIHQAIVDCDLIVVLIGGKWLEILKERTAAGGQDALVREIRAGLKQEKEIVPLLVDGASMPEEGDLPAQIRSFHYQNGIVVSSQDSIDTLATALADPTSRVASTSRLSSRWGRTYTALAFVAYFLCALLPHFVGVMEFGRDTWTGLIAVWSGLFVWPILFLPFALIGMRRPFLTLIESSINTPRLRDKLLYLSPLAVGTVVTAGVLLLEIMSLETPWTIHPVLPGCAATSAFKDSDALSHYGASSDAEFKTRYGNEFWMKDKGKCWPNAFFYLIVPAYQNIANAGYRDSRPQLVRDFKAMLSNSSAPYSALFFPYIVSFAILAWIGCTGVAMSVLYVLMRIRRPSDGSVLSLPSEDAYLCLTYTFVTVMIWVPFRINTNYFKYLSLCENLGNCSIDPKAYFTDIVLVEMLVICYAFLSAGLLVKYRRLALGSLGAFAVMVSLLCAFALLHFRQELAPLTDTWQFFVTVSIPVFVAMAALWYQFDPAVVHFNDFRRDVE